MKVFQRTQHQDHARMKVFTKDPIPRPGWYESFKTVLLNTGTGLVCPKVDTYQSNAGQLPHQSNRHKRFGLQAMQNPFTVSSVSI